MPGPIMPGKPGYIRGRRPGSIPGMKPPKGDRKLRPWSWEASAAENPWGSFFAEPKREVISVRHTENGY